MAKRKSSIMAGTVAPGESSAANDPTTNMDKATHDASVEEYRNYLLSSAGITAEETEMPPPAKNCKTSAAKKTTKAKANEEDGADAKTGESAPVTPRNAAAAVPKKSKATPKKRKASESATEESPESKNDSGLEGDGTTITPPKAKKAKAATQKGETAEADAPEDEQQPIDSIPPRPAKKTKAAPEKRKAIDPNATPEDKDAADDASPPKKRKRAPPKRKDSNDVAQDLPPQRPAAQPLTLIVAAKVKRVQNLINDRNEQDSLLSRDQDTLNTSLIHITERQLLGALMRLRADYEIGNAYEAHLSDISEQIVNRFEAPYKQAPRTQAWVTIDANAPVSELEGEIQEKIRGHGLEQVSLLEIELEMLERQEQEAAALKGVPEGERSSWDPMARVSGPDEMRAFFQKTWEGVLEREALAAREDEATALAEVTIPRVDCEERMGVCPRPMVMPV